MCPKWFFYEDEIDIYAQLIMQLQQNRLDFYADFSITWAFEVLYY